MLFINSFSHGTYISIVTIYLVSNLIGRMVCNAELYRKSQLERAGISNSTWPSVLYHLSQAYFNQSDHGPYDLVGKCYQRSQLVNPIPAGEE